MILKKGIAQFRINVIGLENFGMLKVSLESPSGNRVLCEVLQYDSDSVLCRANLNEEGRWCGMLNAYKGDEEYFGAFGFYVVEGVNNVNESEVVN